MVNFGVPQPWLSCSLAVLALLPCSPVQASSWGTTQTITSWNYRNGRCTDNNELETYSPSCVYYENGALVIKTYKGSDGNYYSGRIESTASYGYGKYTFNVNFPHGQGLLPAVWAAYLNPWLPEIDAAEVVGQNPGAAYQTFHDWSHHQTQWSMNYGYWWTDSWHTFSFIWYPDRIEYYHDGTYTGTISYATGTCSMHLIVDTAVGGNWPGNPNSSTWATSDGARYLKMYYATYQPYYP